MNTNIPHAHHPLTHAVNPPHQPTSQLHTVSPRHEAGSVNQTHESPSSSGTRFTPQHVFNHWVMNMMAKSVPKPLRERFGGGKRKVLTTSTGSQDSEEEDGVDPVGGRIRAAEVSLALNLMRQNSSGDEWHKVDDELKARKLNPMQRLQVYIKAASHVEETGLSPEDANRVKEALEKALQGIQSLNRNELRQALHDPDKLREKIEEIAGPIDKLASVVRRELRNSFDPGRPHTEMNRIDVPLEALSMLKAFVALVGPEHCMKALPVFRKLWGFLY